MFVTTFDVKQLKINKKNMKAMKKCLKTVRKELKRAVPALNVEAQANEWNDGECRKRLAGLFNEIVRDFNNANMLKLPYVALKMDDHGSISYGDIINPIC